MNVETEWYNKFQGEGWFLIIFGIHGGDYV